MCVSPLTKVMKDRLYGGVPDGGVEGEERRVLTSFSRLMDGSLYTALIYQFVNYKWKNFGAEGELASGPVESLNATFDQC